MPWLRSTLLFGLGFLSILAPGAAGSGFLVPRNGSAPLRLRSQRVEAVVEDGLARTTVRQTFEHADGAPAGPLEAIYAFPIPEGAALVDLALELGDQRLEGLLAERKVARRVYVTIVGGGRDPAIVEQIGRSSFRLSVFPVLPDQPTTVELTWLETIPRVDGELTYVYPLALLGDAATTKQDLTVSVTLRSWSAKIDSATSPTEGMVVRRVSDHEVHASFERTGTKLDRDVLVTAKTRTSSAAFAVHVFRPPRGDAYFAALVTPPDPGDGVVLSRDVTLAIDVSGSMRGAKLDQAKGAAFELIDGLRPDDRVNVILFDTVVRRFAARPADAARETLASLRSFVNGAAADGGTALGDAIRLACNAPADPGRVATVVLLTDGVATVGESDPATLVAVARDAAERGLSVYTFGVGEDVASGLLDGVASAGGGAAEVFRPEGELGVRLRRFLTRTSSPAIADLSVTVGRRAVDDLFPRPLPPIHLGEQLWLTGRVSGEGLQPVEITGTVNGAKLFLSTMVDVGRADHGHAWGRAFVRELYGRASLTYLERALRLRGALTDDAFFAALDRGAYSTKDDVVAAAIDVSLETGVQSAYTSFLALLPEDRARLDPRDTAALDEALRRAHARRVELAGVEPESGPDVSSRAVDLVVREAPSERFEDRVADVLGVGGGASGAAGGRSGGKYGGRGSGHAGGRSSLVEDVKGGTWLGRHQDPRGGWSASRFSDTCEKNRCDGAGAAEAGVDVGVTSLALLAFLGAGNTVNHGRYKVVIQKATRFLLDAQDQESGRFDADGAHQVAKTDHALATLALVETYGLSKWPVLKVPAQRALDALCAARSADGGWQFDAPADGRGAATQLAWTANALNSGRAFGLRVDPAAVAAARAGLDALDGAEPSEAPAILFGLLHLGVAPDHPRVLALAATVSASPPVWDESLGKFDLAAWTFGAFAMFELGGEHWNRWQGPLLEAVVKTERKDGDERGSWDPQFARWGERGGRVYSTAMLSLCLETYYRYDRLGVR